MKRLFLTLIALFSFFTASSQYSTRFISKLINDKDYKYIVGETSGERIINNALDLAGYERYNRDFTNLWESEQLLRLLNEYGIEGAEIRRYPCDKKIWSAVEGNIWTVGDAPQKLVDIADIPPAIAVNSCDADVTAELIWVGEATEKELVGLDLTGKIAVGSTKIQDLHKAVAKKGIVGVISVFNLRPFIDATQISNFEIVADLAKETNTFGFQISPREGSRLITRLKGGEKVVVRAVVKTTMVDMEYQSPTCYIAGSDPNAGEITFSAHLFEGYTKLGANDNMSGSVVNLEVARTLKTLIDKGILEQPKRTLRFIWGDEFSGIYPWVDENKELMDKTLFNINLDMVGVSLIEQRCAYHLHRTTMANSHYANDIAENIFKYIGMTNQFSMMTGNFKDPIISATGSEDPFYYSISYHTGASDHEVFNDWGTQVPSLMMITWPDDNYHTSADRVDALDATQLKRAAVIAAVTAYYAAIADEDEAIKICEEVAVNSIRRIATQHTKVANEIDIATDLNGALKSALYQIDAILIAEKMAIKSVEELAPSSSKLSKYIALQQKQAESYCQSVKEALVASVEIRGGDTSIKMSSLEKEASKIYPKSTALVREGGFGVLNRTLAAKKGIDLGTDFRKLLFGSYSNYRLSNNAEAARLTRDGDKSVLDIYKMLSAQFPQPTKLEDLMGFMNELEDSGLITK